jgi:hypothetical protein
VPGVRNLFVAVHENLTSRRRPQQWLSPGAAFCFNVKNELEDITGGRAGEKEKPESPRRGVAGSS